MRDAFSNALVALAKADPNVLLLTGDHGYALFDAFRRECPNQYVNAGIAEQNMVGMAAGLARAGFRPFVYGLSAFIPVRVLEQIKLDVAHDNLPVIFIGDGAGFVYSHLGTSHQSTEDIACTRAIPRLRILSPADRHEMMGCMNLAYELKAPIYLRIGKSDCGDVHSATLAPLQLGRLLCLRKGAMNQPALIATGSMVRPAMNIATDKLDLSVWSAPSIKPLSGDDICNIAAESKGLVVMEEHSILGGLGSAVAEIISEYRPTSILRIGVNDRFTESCGSYGHLLKEHGLDTDTVRLRIQKFAATDNFN